MKEVLESISDLFVDGYFEFDSSGFDVQATDSGLVALVALRMRSMQHYQCDRGMSMRINLNNMTNMLKLVTQKDDILTLEAVIGGGTVTFIFESPAQNMIANIEMKLVPEKTGYFGIPESENHDAIVTMPSAEFASICTHFSSIGDTVEISLTNEELSFSTEGDIGDANFRRKHKKTPKNSTIVQMKEPVSSTVALTYLNFFTKATALSDTVTISLTLYRPVLVEYKIDGGGHIRFYLTPLIEEDDEGTT